jgi:hypothetical protein
MVTHYNTKYFTAKVNGEEIEFVCYTTYTRAGFCHTAHYMGWVYDINDTKQTYYNRTWERFDYETVLKRAITKLPKHLQESVYAQIIEGKAAEEHEKAEAMVKSFEALHSSLSDENKDRLANSGIEIHSEEDAHAVMGLMSLMSLMQ